MLYFKLLRLSFRQEMQHRASFIMTTVALFIATGIEISGIWVLFDRFKLLNGWSLEELAIIYGTIHMGFAASESLARGFDNFYKMIRDGSFDRVLLRPFSCILQIAAKDAQLMRIGRFLQGFLVLLWGAYSLDLAWFSLSIIVLSFLGTFAFFYALFVIQATLSFWTIESLEVMNIFSYGSVEMGQFPMSIYKPIFLNIFTFVIPLASVGYYPLSILLKEENFPLYMAYIFPLFGFLFLFLSFQFWKFGVRYYVSAGN